MGEFGGERKWIGERESGPEKPDIVKSPERGKKLSELSEAEEKIVNELESIYRGNRETFKRVSEKKENVDKVLALMKKQVPEIEPDSAERVLNAFIKRVPEKNISLVIFPAIESINETNIMREKAEETKQLKPLKIKLNLEGLKRPIDYPGARNPINCDLTIRGNCGDNFGYKMRGGVVKNEGNAGDKAAKKMRGGELYIFGNAGKGIAKGMEKGKLYVFGDVIGFDSSAFREENKGRIFQWKEAEGKKELKQIWPKEEKPSFAKATEGEVKKELA